MNTEMSTTDKDSHDDMQRSCDEYTTIVTFPTAAFRLAIVSAAV